MFLWEKLHKMKLLPAVLRASPQIKSCSLWQTFSITPNSAKTKKSTKNPSRISHLSHKVLKSSIYLIYFVICSLMTALAPTKPPSKSPVNVRCFLDICNLFIIFEKFISILWLWMVALLLLLLWLLLIKNWKRNNSGGGEGCWVQCQRFVGGRLVCWFRSALLFHCKFFYISTKISDKKRFVVIPCVVS